MRHDNTESSGWIILLVDILSIIIAFYLAGFIRGGILNPYYMSGIYGNLQILLILSTILIGNISNGNKNIFKRGFYEELKSVVKNQGVLALILLAYMFFIKEGSLYSRIFLGVFFLLNISITYVTRCYTKLILLLAYKKSSSSSKVMLITTSKHASGTIRKIRKEYEWRICVTTIALWDKNRIGERIDGIEVIADRNNLLDMAKLSVVDEVFIHLPYRYGPEMEEIILELENMGIVVHINLDMFTNLNVKEKTIEDFAGHQVITFSSALYDTRKIVIKRIMDGVGGLVGSIFTILLTLILTPIIFIESPGPIFFSQIRIGKNGRKFRIYKFRSMYPDAEQRKKELLDQNEMSGLMFKMTDDPRITKVGKFIRKTSLDEFPQFFNVLKGDMSLVGTRPPTEDEFIQYEGRHKRRLSLKPGLTGLWQVSGRSDIQDFEEVVKLDLEYIDNWSLKLDIKLLVKTVVVVLGGKGSK